MNAYDNPVQFNFIIARIPGRVITAADSMPRMEKDPKEKLVSNVCEDVETQVNVKSAGASEKRFSTEGDVETEAQI